MVTWSDRQTRSGDLTAEKECETAHLDFYTFVTSLPSIGLCLQVSILTPVLISFVVRDCV